MKCALLITSGSLILQNYTPQIDSHDFVIRTGSKYNCDEIKNGAVGKEREKERNHCVEKYKKQIDEKRKSIKTNILSNKKLIKNGNNI